MATSRQDSPESNSEDDIPVGPQSRKRRQIVVFSSDEQSQDNENDSTSEGREPRSRAERRRRKKARSAREPDGSSSDDEVPIMTPAEAASQTILLNDTIQEDFVDLHHDTTAASTIYQDKRLSNAQRMERFLAVSEHAPRSPVNIKDILQATVNDLLQNAEPVAGRNYRFEHRLKSGTVHDHKYARGHVMVGRSGDSWKIKFTSKNQPTVTFSAPVEEPYGIDVLSPKNLRLLAPLLVKLLNRFPYTVPTDSTVKRHLLRAAVHSLAGGSMAFNAPSWTVSGWKVHIPYIDKNGKHEKFERAWRGGMSLQHNPPRIPGHVIFQEASSQRVGTLIEKKEIDGIMHWTSVLPDDFDPATSEVYRAKQGKTQPTLAELRQREEFLRWAVWNMDGCFSSHEEMFAAMDKLENMYTGEAQGTAVRRYSAFGASVLRPRIIHTEPGTVRFRTGGQFERQLGLHTQKMILTLRTMNKLWIAAVLEAADTEYHKQRDISAALMAAAQCCDDIHAAIELGADPPGHCTCNDNMRLSTQHPCADCLIPQRCADMVLDIDGSKICTKCHGEAPDKESLMTAVVRASLKRNITKEFAARGLSKKDERLPEIINATFDEVIEQLEGCQPREYRDLYSKETHRQPANYSAFSVSVDAVLPFLRRVDVVLSHLPGNIALTPIWLNLAKSQYLPGQVQLCVDWAKSDKSQETTRVFLERMEELHIVNLAWPKQRIRLPQNIEQSALNRMKHEWITGLRLNRAQLNKAQRRFKHIVEANKLRENKWSVEQKRNLINICENIADRFGTQGQLDLSSDDECPWPAQLGQRPQDWSWNHLYTFCLDRFVRLKNSCNRHWLTIDDPFRMGCELFYQLSTDEPEYDNLLGLPMVLAMGHPLCVSFGHKRHGEQMFSGWRENPTCLADRDNSKNNLKLLTTLENRAEWNWPSKEYPMIIKSWEKVDMPSEFFDKDGTLPPYSSLPDADSDVGDDEFDPDEVEIPTSEQIADLQAVFIARDKALDAAEEQTEPSAPSMAGQQTSTEVVVQTPHNTARQARQTSLPIPSSAFPWKKVMDRIRSLYDAALVKEHGYNTADTRGYVKEPMFNNTLHPSMRTLEALDPYSAPPPTEDAQPGTEHWIPDDLLRRKLQELEQPPHSSISVDAEIATQALLTHNSALQYSSEALRARIFDNGTLIADGRGSDGTYPPPPALTCNVLHRIFNYLGNHWVHLELRADRKTMTGIVYVRDSMESPCYTDVLSLARAYAQDDTSPWHNIKWRVEIVQAPQQGNTSNCGVHALESVRQALAGETPKMPVTSEERLRLGEAIRAEWMSKIYFDITGENVDGISSEDVPVPDAEQFPSPSTTQKTPNLSDVLSTTPFGASTGKPKHVISTVLTTTDVAGIHEVLAKLSPGEVREFAAWPASQFKQEMLTKMRDLAGWVAMRYYAILAVPENESEVQRLKRIMQDLEIIIVGMKT